MLKIKIITKNLTVIYIYIFFRRPDNSTHVIVIGATAEQIMHTDALIHKEKKPNMGGELSVLACQVKQQISKKFLLVYKNLMF